MRVMLGARLVAILLAPADAAAVPSNDDAFEPVAIQTPTRADDVSAGVRIRGTATNANTHEQIVGARVVLDCACLGQTREQRTDEEGRYRFGELPEGAFTVTLFGERGQLTKVIDTSAGATFVANFSIDPNSEIRA